MVVTSPSGEMALLRDNGQAHFTLIGGRPAIIPGPGADGTALIRVERRQIVLLDRATRDGVGAPPPATWRDGVKRAAGAAADLARRITDPVFGDKAYHEYMAMLRRPTPDQAVSPADILRLAGATFARDPEGVAGTLSTDRIETQRFSDCSVRSSYNHPELAPVRAVMSYDRFLNLSENLSAAPLRRRGTYDFEKQRILERLGYTLSDAGVVINERYLVESLRADGALFGSIRFRQPLLAGNGEAFHSIVVNGALRTPEGWRFVVTDSNSTKLHLYSFEMLERKGLRILTLSRDSRRQPDGTARPLSDVEIVTAAQSALREHGEAAPALQPGLVERLTERWHVGSYRPMMPGTLARLDLDARARVRLGDPDAPVLTLEAAPLSRFVREFPAVGLELLARPENAGATYVVYDVANPRAAAALKPFEIFRVGKDARIPMPPGLRGNESALLTMHEGVFMARSDRMLLSVAGRAAPLPPASAYGPDGAPVRVGAAEPASNAAFLARVEAETPYKGVGTRPPEWAALAAPLPKVTLERVLSGEGSTGPVMEGRLEGGERVAVKAFREPMYQEGWKTRVRQVTEEVALYREFEDALPRGWVAKGHGLVDTGGSPAFAMGVIEGKDGDQLTVRQALAISELAIDQLAAATMFLNRRGLRGMDSPQEMFLTRDQVINGVPRKAGELVFMDAGALERAPEPRGFSETPQGKTSSLLFTRALARLYGEGKEDMTIAQLARSIPNEQRLALVDRARAAAAARPLPALERFGPPVADEGPVKVGASEPPPLRQTLDGLLGDPAVSGRLGSYESALARGDQIKALAVLRKLEERVRALPEAVFEQASLHQEIGRLEVVVRELEARAAEDAAARTLAAKLEEQRAVRIPASLSSTGLARHFNEGGGVYASGVDGAHRPALFEAALENGRRGFEVEARQRVPAFPGLSVARYKVYRTERRVPTPQLRDVVLMKTLFDPALWPDQRIEFFARQLFADAWPAKKAEVEAELAAGRPLDNDNVTVRVTRGRVTFVGWVDWRTGVIQSYGVETIAP